LAEQSKASTRLENFSEGLGNSKVMLEIIFFEFLISKSRKFSLEKNKN